MMMEEDSYVSALSQAQCIYLDAQRRFEALEAMRDRLLEPLTSGEPFVLTAAEHAELAWLDREERKVYPLVLAAEAPLLAAARAWLSERPSYLAQYPEYALVITIPRGKRERAVELAAGLDPNVPTE